MIPHIIFGFVGASICAGVAVVLSWSVLLTVAAYVIGGVIGMIIALVWLSGKPANREELARQVHTRI